MAGTLRRTASVTLDVNGNGTLQFFTDHANQVWQVRSIVVSTTQAATARPFPVVQATVGSHSYSFTYNGQNDTLNLNAEMTAPDILNVTFTGGIAGTIGSAWLNGTYSMRGRNA